MTTANENGFLQSGTSLPSEALVKVAPTSIIPLPKNSHFTPVGLVLADGCSFEDWITVGKTLKTVSDGIQWNIGDWLNYGERTYGEKYAEALEATGYDYQSLANMKTVSKKIKLSLRRENLSWSHHKEVVGLEPKQQTMLLDWAEKENASVKDLRTKIKIKSEPTPNTTAVQELREWLDGLDAAVQRHVDYGKKSQNFDLELRDLTSEEVKLQCEMLRTARSAIKSEAA